MTTTEHVPVVLFIILCNVVPQNCRMTRILLSFLPEFSSALQVTSFSTAIKQQQQQQQISNYISVYLRKYPKQKKLKLV